MKESLSKCEAFQARLQYLFDKKILSESSYHYLGQNLALSPALAEGFIENAIGYFGVPLGIAEHFVINGKAYYIPMAIEETSVIAAASKTAKWIHKQGEINTTTIGDTLIGQIQIPMMKSPEKLQKLLDEVPLQSCLNETVAQNMVKRGGGVKAISLRTLPYQENQPGQMGVIHIEVDVRDAMGANLVNQICEAAKHYLRARSEEQFNICILSNFNPQTLTKVEIILDEIPCKMGEAIEACSRFAEMDPYRAATHNKGIMNGIDAVLLATGNDWRAVEAGLHAYAGKDIGYQPLSRWRYQSGQLKGQFEGPINVGIVGGVTKLHPIAKISLEILNPQSARELSEIVAAVGLVQNLGAMRALSTTGITQGHMRLHIDNIVMEFELDSGQKMALKMHLEQKLKEKNMISKQDAIEYLDKNNH